MQLPRVICKRTKDGHKKSALGREIAVMLLIKVVLLYGLWLAFFNHPAIPNMTRGMDPGRVAAVLVAPPPPVSRTPTEDSAL